MKVGLSGESSLFELISGFTITEEFNETLDNATIKFRSGHRLNIKPYDEVCFDNGHCMLVDNFVEIQESLITEQYLYTVNLMSLTKLLEKIQLPNRVITHSLVKGQTNIYSYINWYVNFYAPKIKMLNDDNTWSYKKLFVNKLSYYKYNVKCRDLQFSKPTLRQALTTLMLQVGCIPVLKKNPQTKEIELHDIDFRTKGNNITQLDNYCNYITRSNASDSYVNRLKSVSSNVLDDENIVISENIGFRDSDNVFIKQKENLKLTTRFPIYKIDKMYINFIGNGAFTIKGENPFIYESLLSLEKSGSSLNLVSSDLTLYENLYDLYEDIVVNAKVYAYETETIDGKPFFKNFSYVEEVESYLSADNYELAGIPGAEGYAYLVIGNITATRISDSQQVSGNLIIATDDLDFQSFTYNQQNTYGLFRIYYPYKADFTPLIVEQSKRQLLKTDFTEMLDADITSLAQLSQYIYGTVGYKIGTNVIEGFSQTYDVAKGWWKEEYTYFENILDFYFNIPNRYSLGQDFSGAYREKILESRLGGIPNISNFFISELIEDTDYTNFARFTFDIEYQPLNILNITHSKENTEINIPIEQYDSSDNAISNLNDIVNVEQQKVNRLGNDVITINQRIPLSANNTGYELNDRILGEYIIFKKEMQYNPYDIQIVYTASKDYVLQNFFTAIQTKYRAYEYVPYGQSIERQENTTIYGLIDRFYINGDDQISWGNVALANQKNEQDLLSGLSSNYDFFKKLISCGVGVNTYYKNDLSIVKTKNVLAFITQMYDSVSYGQKLNPTTETTSALGGYEQEWYINHNLSATALFLSNTNGIDFFNLDESSETNDIYNKVLSLPLMDNIEKYLGENNIEVNNKNLLFLVDNNSITDKLKIYYLDQQELLNQTIQFEFYTTDSGIKWTEKLWELCNLVCDKPKGNKYIYIGVNEEFGINENGYTSIDTSKLISYDTEQIALFSGLLLGTGSGFTIKWSNIATNIDFMKVVYEENDIYYDLIAVERNGNNASDKIYISLNDTKSLKVGSQRNGCLTFNEYEVAKNTLNRNVKKL